MKLKFNIFIIIFSLLAGSILNVKAAPGGEPTIIKNEVSKALEKAAENGINTILILTDKNETGMEEAVTMANETVALSKNTMIAVVNRDEKENAEIISKYQMTRFPSPYLLILSPGGNITGGVAPGKISAEKFAEYLPTACYNKVLAARDENRPIFTLIYKDQDDQYKEWLGMLEEVQSAMDPKAEIITVSAKDESESSFLKKLRYDGKTNGPVIVVLNTAGQLAGQFDTKPEVVQLTEAATNVAKKGCGSTCPSSKSCSDKEKAKCGDK